jgi:quercetin dioxygenase-like cupin family protein
MFILKKIITVFCIFFFLNVTAFAKEDALYFDFNAMPVNHLTDKINMRFVTSNQFTVIQWDLMQGAKLPTHSHLNEQVIRILKGNIEVHTGDKIYHLHEGDVMVFPPYVTHGFTATMDAIMYEQQTPIRQDFLEPGFIEKLSQYLKQHQ